MTIEEVLKICPDLLKIKYSDYTDVLYGQFNPNKTWTEMGLDDLDIVEMIMKLEKKLNFDLPDFILDDVFSINMKPINFIEIIRQKKLDDLGI